MPTPAQIIERRARLFRDGRNQAVRIPREFKLPGDEIILYKNGEHLIVEPGKKPTHLLDWNCWQCWNPSNMLFPIIERPTLSVGHQHQYPIFLDIPTDR